jgi:Uma2 family endonuclease
VDKDDPIERNPERSAYRQRVRDNIYRSLSTNSVRDSASIEEPDNVDLMAAVTGHFESSASDDEAGGWTEDALELVPSGVHYEIEDGRLVVSPRPPPWHQTLCYLLNKALEAHCPAHLWPVQDAEIRVYDEDHEVGQIVQARAPDLMAMPRSLARPGAERPWAHPSEVALALEVVSPSSRIADRITKVGVYAEWKIPLYLLFESGPQSAMYEYRLDPSRKIYRTPIAHLDVFETEEPFPIRIDLSALR